MLLTYYGSPVCAKYNFTCAIIMFISNLKKKNPQMSGHSENLKDPKYTLAPRGLKQQQHKTFPLHLHFI